MKPATKSLFTFYRTVTVYRDDLEEIAELLERELGRAALVSTDKYRYDSLQEFLTVGKERRPNELWITGTEIDDEMLKAIPQPQYSGLAERTFIAVHFSKNSCGIHADRDTVRLEGLSIKLARLLQAKRRVYSRIIYYFYVIFVSIVSGTAGYNFQSLSFGPAVIVLLMIAGLNFSIFIVSKWVDRVRIIADKSRQEASFVEKHAGALVVGLITTTTGAVLAALFKLWTG